MVSLRATFQLSLDFPKVIRNWQIYQSNRTEKTSFAFVVPGLSATPKFSQIGNKDAGCSVLVTTK